jgi:Na+/H+ antiporter NhaC
MVAIMSSRFTEDKSPCNGFSVCMLVSSTVSEIKILLMDQISYARLCLMSLGTELLAVVFGQHVH